MPAYATTAALTAETNARQSADSALDQRLDVIEASTALAAETTARQSADSALDQRLDVVEAWIVAHPDGTLPPPPPPTAVIYGSGVSGDSRANEQIGAALNAKLAYRFRATGGQATSIRVQERGGTTYSGGNGGTIQASIQTDNAGVPSGTILGSVTWVPGNPAGNWEVWPVHTFSAPIALTAGTLYHLVFKNTAVDPINNWISLNMLYTFGTMPTPRQPAFSDDFATLYAQPTTWQLQPQHLPIFDLAYVGGPHDGQGYIGTLWDMYGRISGSVNMVRERFTPTTTSTIQKAHVRLKRISGTGALVLRLEKADGSVVEQITVPSSAIAIGLLPDGSASSLAGDTWVHATFGAPHTINSGQAYNLQLSTDAATLYTAVPIQEGGSKGLSSRRFTDGDGQRTTDSGANWSNLYLYDSVDLQFYLSS